LGLQLAGLGQHGVDALDVLALVTAAHGFHGVESLRLDQAQSDVKNGRLRLLATIYPYGYNPAMDIPPKSLYWVASSRKDLKALPEEVQDIFGYALYLAQTGTKHDQAKPLKGFGGAGVLEVVEDYHGDTYRAVYTIKLADAVYVLHCFQKKSTQGIATPKPDLDLIRDRLKAAEAHAKGHGK
jgi:phage-related protein